MSQNNISHSLFYQECNGLKMYTLSQFTNRGTRECQDKILMELGSFVKVGLIKAHTTPELIHVGLVKTLSEVAPLRSTKWSKKWDLTEDLLLEIKKIMNY